MARPKPTKAQRNRRSTITICILASVAFWLSIKLSNSYTAEEEIAITYSLPDGLAFAQAPPSTLTASVKATGWELLLQRIQPKTRNILVDSSEMANNPDGIISIRQAVAKAFADEGLKVDAMTNERIVLQTEQVNSKRVPLKLISAIAYKPGFASTNQPTLTPDSVTLTGPGSLLDSVTYWETDSVLLDNIFDTIVTVGLPRRDPAGRIRVEPKQIDVGIQSQQFTEKALYVPVGIRRNRTLDSVSIFPQQVLVTCSVGLADYEQISEKDYSVFIDLSALAPGAQRGVQVELENSPAKAKNIKVQPKTVDVFIVE